MSSDLRTSNTFYLSGMAPREIRRDDNQNNKPAGLNLALAASKAVAQRKIEIQKRSRIPQYIARESNKVYQCCFALYADCDFVVTRHGLLSGMAATHLNKVHQVTASDMKVAPLGQYKFIKKQVVTKDFFKIKFKEIGSTLEQVCNVLKTRKAIGDVSLSLDNMSL